MANPKRKWSKARSARSRSNWKLSKPGLTECPQCHTLRMPHRMCLSCGYYKGKAVVQSEEQE